MLTSKTYKPKIKWLKPDSSSPLRFPDGVYVTENNTCIYRKFCGDNEGGTGKVVDVDEVSVNDTMLDYMDYEFLVAEKNILAFNEVQKPGPLLPIGKVWSGGYENGYRTFVGRHKSRLGIIVWKPDIGNKGVWGFVQDGIQNQHSHVEYEIAESESLESSTDVDLGDNEDRKILEEYDEEVKKVQEKIYAERLKNLFENIETFPFFRDCHVSDKVLDVLAHTSSEFIAKLTTLYLKTIWLKDDKGYQLEKIHNEEIHEKELLYFLRYSFGPGYRKEKGPCDYICHIITTNLEQNLAIINYEIKKLDESLHVDDANRMVAGGRTIHRASRPPQETSVVTTSFLEDKEDRKILAEYDEEVKKVQEKIYAERLKNMFENIETFSTFRDCRVSDKVLGVLAHTSSEFIAKLTTLYLKTIWLKDDKGYQLEKIHNEKIYENELLNFLRYSFGPGYRKEKGPYDHVCHILTKNLEQNLAKINHEIKKLDGETSVVTSFFEVLCVKFK